MAGRLLSFTPPTRSDYLLLALVIVFALYAHWGVNAVTSTPEYGGAEPGFVGSTNLAFAIIPAGALVVALLISVRGQKSQTDLGCTFARKEYAGITIVLFILLAIHFVTQYPESSPFSSGRLAIIALNIVAGEVILRACLMELILKLLGRTAVAVSFAFVLTAILYAWALVPHDGSVSLALSWGLGTSFLYYGMRSVLPLVLLDSLIFSARIRVPGAQLLMTMMVILYVALVFLVTRSSREQSKIREGENGYS